MLNYIHFTISVQQLNMKRFNLENRVSIITGGAGLLGFQHAQALVEVNSRIVLIDTNYKHLLKHKNFFNKN